MGTNGIVAGRFERFDEVLEINLSEVVVVAVVVGGGSIVIIIVPHLGLRVAVGLVGIGFVGLNVVEGGKDWFDVIMIVAQMVKIVVH